MICKKYTLESSSKHQEIMAGIHSLRRDDGNGNAIWIVDISVYYDYEEEIEQWLTHEEIQRLNKINNPTKRRIHCLRKGITRAIISQFFRIPLNEVAYQYTANGKPYIVHDEKEKYGFNISHSKNVLLVGLVKGKELGVDIEKINDTFDYELLEESVLSNDEKAVYKNCSITEKREVFYKIWVQKEAVSKAIGVGISIGFNQFSVKFNPSICAEQYLLDIPNIRADIEMSTNSTNDYIYATASYK